MANRNFLSQKLYQMEAYPVLISCNFVVTPTNGLGITLLKGALVRNVFMHTSTTPTANNGYTNPNPENGVIAVQLQDSYNKFLGLMNSSVSYTDGSSQTSTTTGRLSVISVLGTATLAQWQAKGLPVGITPAVGVAFIATATGAIGGSGAVQRPLWSGISKIEIGADPNLTLQSANSPVNGGSWMFFQTLADVISMGAYTPTGTNSAPAFTGSALGNHAHSLLLKNAAVADGATTRVNAGTNLLGANTGSDITVAGAGANGGVQNASAGTPAGTVAAPVFTGDAASLTGTSAQARTAPVTGSIISLSFYLSNSSVTVNGQ